LGDLYKRADPGWQFDLYSALIGFGLGILASAVVFLIRHRVSALREKVTARGGQLRASLSKGSQQRYREQIAEMSERAHVLKRYAPLSEIYVEPRLAVPLTRSTFPSMEDNQKNEEWRQEYMYDILHPSPETIGLGDALKQCTRLAILGPTGSGRTALLAYMAGIYARGEGWRFSLPPPEEGESAELQAARQREQERLPVSIALEYIDLSLAPEEGKHPLLEPISGYLAVAPRGFDARGSASLVRNEIVRGRCLLLLDNLDVLDTWAQTQVLGWLNRLSRTYPDNVYVVTGLPEGYGRLWETGFMPLMLRGFERPQVFRLVDRWESLREHDELAVWQNELSEARALYEQEVAQAAEEGRPPAPEADFLPAGMPGRPPGLLRVWTEGHKQQVLPLDLAQAALLWRERDAVPATSLMRHAQVVLLALNRIEDSPLDPPQWARVIGSVAWTMRSEGRTRAHRSEFEMPVTDLLSRPGTDARRSEDAQAGNEELANVSRPARRAFDALLETGDLLVDVGHEEIAFAYPTLCDYFCAQHAARNALVEGVVAHVRDPRWKYITLFYSAMTQADPLVEELLARPDDLFRADLLAAAHHLATSSRVDQRVRQRVLGDLAGLFRDSKRPTVLRRRAAEAVASIGDKGALYLFGQALGDVDPYVRRLGIWGLVQMNDERVVDGLVHVLSDPNPLVRVEALHALGALGGDQVIDGLVQGLQDEDGLPRRIAAETLASVGGEGLDVLCDAAASADMFIRRAALYGLGTIHEPWALDIAERLSREDAEWYVRSAAIEVLKQARADPSTLSPEPPRLQGEGWLQTWAVQQGIDVGTDQAALQATLRAVQERGWALKWAAADALRICGGLEAIPPLRGMMNDDDSLVREAAYGALAEIGLREGIHIPSLAATTRTSEGGSNGNGSASADLGLDPLRQDVSA
jgi:HEAT repeat protein